MTLFNRILTYYSLTGSRGADGRWVDVITGPKTCKGTAQPVTARDLEATEQGRQEQGQIKIYTSTALTVSVQGGGAGDHVLFDGAYWEIIQRMPNQNGIISHYKYIAAVRPNFDASGVVAP